MKDVPHEQLLAMESSSDSLGSLLARARNARRLEHREAAMRLGVSTGVIEALEENEFQRLGAPVFVRGYLTRYAHLLDLPEEEVLDRYKRLGISDPPPLRVSPSIKPQAKMSDTGVRWISYLLVFGIIAYLGWLGLDQVSSHFESPASQQTRRDADGDTSLALPHFESSTPEKTEPPTAEVPASIPATTPPPSSVRKATPERQQVVSQEEVAGTPDAGQSSPPAVAETTVTVEDTAASRSTVEETAEPAEAVVGGASMPEGELRLVMEFTDDCWVDIKDANGERLAFGLLKANTTHTVSGKGPFSLVLGNAPAVNIELNGQPIDKSAYVPRRGTVARFTLEVPAAGSG